jgi:RNA polymerase subunit RPABC4/transcription elongation factor Spt4
VTKWLCKSCGAMNPSGSLMCTNCIDRSRGEAWYDTATVTSEPHKTREALEAENKRMRKALERYAVEENWYSRKILLGNGTQVGAPAFGFGPSIARESLKEEK